MNITHIAEGITTAYSTTECAPLVFMALGTLNFARIFIILLVLNMAASAVNKSVTKLINALWEKWKARKKTV